MKLRVGPEGGVTVKVVASLHQNGFSCHEHESVKKKIQYVKEPVRFLSTLRLWGWKRFSPE